VRKARNTVDDPEQWIADYKEKLALAATNAQAASADLRQVGGTVTSPRGEVTVTVSASGALEDLTFSAAARRLDADRLARLILATVREAQRKVSTQVVQIMSDFAGESPALEFVRQVLPPGVQTEDASAADRKSDDRDDDSYFANPLGGGR
jgi:DNA-binding protein YbaB